MNQSFSSQSEAITHDSDLRKLSFVKRNNVTGAEIPIDIQQIIDGLPPNPELLPLKYTTDTDNPVFSRPFELRNRNRASFQMKFVKPKSYIQEPVVTPYENPAPEVVTHNEVSWGLNDIGTNLSVATPSLLLMPAAPVSPASIILTKIKVTVASGDHFYSDAGPGSLELQFVDYLGEKLLDNVLLTTDGIYETPSGFALKCQADQITVYVKSTMLTIDQFNHGQFTIELQFEIRTPSGIVYCPASWFNALPLTTVTTTLPNPLSPNSILTRAIGYIHPAWSSPYDTFTLDILGPDDNPIMPTATLSYINGQVIDSGPVSVDVGSLGAASLKIKITHITGPGNLTNLNANGLITWQFQWKEPGGVYSWSPGDTLSLLAFVSLDDKQYVPISLARHDWSNTPFVDIIKLDVLNLPEDFDPGDNPPVGISGYFYPKLDYVAFRNAIELFLTDFDNASTWNYIRFLLVWNPSSELLSTNGDVAIEISTNAREL
jgi:hypothetical protein